MRGWDAEQVAAGAGARLARGPAVAGGPSGAAIDTRTIGAGELFVGLPGERTDGGAHAPRALAGGAWGVLVTERHARAALAAGDGAVLVHDQPLAGMQSLARSWREELGARVVAVTGSAGKTSTKDILLALLGATLRTAASPANHNTEIGLPLALLAAAPGTEALVLEMAMRGPGQIAELTAIAAPDVGVIVNIGPAHLELLGSLEAIAAAKAELIAGLAPAASIVVPAAEPLLDPHLRTDLDVITFGDGGDVTLLERRDDGSLLIGHRGKEIELRPSFAERHNLLNLLAAVAAARALGLTPGGRLDVEFSSMRGQRRRLPGGALLIEDCYNANPLSMRAALDELADSASGRRVAVLGDMLELGEQGARLHREVGEHAAARGIELLVAVGPLAREIARGFGGEAHCAPDAQAAAELLGALLDAEDTVLVKASRGMRLEEVGACLEATPTQRGAARTGPGERALSAGRGAERH